MKIDGLDALFYEILDDSLNWDVRFSWHVDGMRFSEIDRQCRIVVSNNLEFLNAGNYDLLDIVLGEINRFYFSGARIPRPRHTAGCFWRVGIRDNGAGWVWSEAARLVVPPVAETLSSLPWISQKASERSGRSGKRIVFDLHASQALERVEFAPMMPYHFKLEIAESPHGADAVCLADFSTSPCIIRGAKWANKIEAKATRGRYLILSDLTLDGDVLNGLPFEVLVTVPGRRGSSVFIVPDDKIATKPMPVLNTAQEKSADIILRKNLRFDEMPVEAVCTYTGLGYCYFYINGKPVVDDLLWPPYTNYTKRVYCRSVDIMPFLRKGPNTLGVTLGNGFRGLPTPDIFGHQRCEWTAPPSSACELLVRFTDGRTKRWTSDNTWQARTGKYTFNCLRGGETIDANLEDSGNFSEQKRWEACVQVAPPLGRILPDASLPIVGAEPLHPVSLKRTKRGSLVVDFGQTMTGIVRFKAGGSKGARIVVRSNDLLMKDGFVDIGNCSQFTYGRFQVDAAVCSAKNHLFEPRYSYKGFRYAEFFGATDKIDKKTIEAVPVTNKQIKAGMLDFSNPTLARLHAACANTLASSMHSIPDDSTREKMGWLGENGLHSYGQFMNFEAHRMYRKWLFDILDTQNADGLVSNMAPENGFWHRTAEGAPPPSHNDPWWCGSLIIVTWNLYLFYNDIDILKIIFPAAKRLMGYIVKHSRDGIVEWNLGDWLELDSKNFPQRSPVGCTGTLALKLLADLMSQMAVVLHQPNDAAQYHALSRKTVDAFRRHFGEMTGAPAFNSQAVWALMLEQGATSGADYTKVLELLVDNVKHEYKGHLSTGSIGTQPVLSMLGKHGYDNEVARILTQKEYPGFGHMLAQGATALWESWNGLESQCHVTYAGVHQFLYESFGALMPGWNRQIGLHLRLAPGRAPSLGNCWIQQRQPLFEYDAVWTAGKRGVQGRLSWKAAHPVVLDFAKCRLRGETAMICINNRKIPANPNRRLIKLPAAGCGEILFENS